MPSSSPSPGSNDDKTTYSPHDSTPQPTPPESINAVSPNFIPSIEETRAARALEIEELLQRLEMLTAHHLEILNEQGQAEQKRATSGRLVRRAIVAAVAMLVISFIAMMVEFEVEVEKV